jgi:Immunoglobulin-like domain of bacterial spore germination
MNENGSGLGETGTAAGGPRRGRRRALLIAAAVVLVALVAGGIVLALSNDEGSHQTARVTTTTPVTSTSSPATTAAPVTTAPVDTSTAVWPFASSTTRYSDPVSAARGFATEYVGFTDPVVGEFQQGDARSGEVPIRAKPETAVTTVLVRQLGDSWWVLGATTSGIQVTSPTALQVVSSPVALRGSSTAFEATVNVQVRADGRPSPLASGFVMGGANGTMGPFDTTLAFATPTAPAGAVMLFTNSSEDGRVLEAAVVRVRFA